MGKSMVFASDRSNFCTWPYLPLTSYLNLDFCFISLRLSVLFGKGKVRIIANDVGKVLAIVGPQ